MATDLRKLEDRHATLLRRLLWLHAAALLLLAAAFKPIDVWDHQADRAAFARVTPRLEAVCDVFVQPGSPYVALRVAVVVGVVLLFRRRWLDCATWIVLLTGVFALERTLKALFRRPRPLNMADWPGWSFPSGHTLGATAVYGMIAYLLVQAMRGRKRVLPLVCAALIVLCVAGGLLVPGYHFVSDVVGGYLIGVCWLAGCILLRNLGNRRFRNVMGG